MSGIHNTTSQLQITIKDQHLKVSSGDYLMKFALQAVQGFDILIQKNELPSRFYIMGESIVHEREGVLRVIGSEMRVHMDRDFEPKDLSLVERPKQEAMTIDYVNLFALNLQHVLETIQAKKDKEWQKKLGHLEKELKNFKGLADATNADLLTAEGKVESLEARVQEYSDGMEFAIRANTEQLHQIQQLKAENEDFRTKTDTQFQQIHQDLCIELDVRPGESLVAAVLKLQHEARLTATRHLDTQKALQTLLNQLGTTPVPFGSDTLT